MLRSESDHVDMEKQMFGPLLKFPELLLDQQTAKLLNGAYPVGPWSGGLRESGRSISAIHTARINLSPFTKDFRVWVAFHET